MARDLGPKCRMCRREGMKLFLKGERCLTEKCAVERRSYPPGEHGRGRIKQSQYLLQLREKQKARRYYGLLEKQFRSTTRRRRAASEPRARTCCGCSRRASTTSSTGSASPARARRRASSCATATSRSTAGGSTSRATAFGPNDVVSLKQGSPVEQLVRDATDLTASVAPWLQADHDGLTGTVLKWPERDEIDAPVQESLIVELYSK